MSTTAHMFAFTYTPDLLISLITLTFLEVVLGVDNLIFISIICTRLPSPQRRLARIVGLLFALVFRLALLAAVLWLVKLTQPLFTLFETGFSIRDLIMIIGGLFLIYKSTFEIHTELEGEDEDEENKKKIKFWFVIAQIVALDIIFSLDSIFTAVGMTQNFWVMAIAICIAIFLMIFASDALSRFVMKRPTVKMLALSFLLMIGTVLIADGFHFHVPRGYIYFALSFSVMVEILNSMVAIKRRRRIYLRRR